MERREPAILVCAWCQTRGRPHGAARPLSRRTWYRVSHTFTAVAAKAGLASHGICPVCWQAVAAELGIPEPSRHPRRQVAA